MTDDDPPSRAFVRGTQILTVLTLAGVLYVSTLHPRLGGEWFLGDVLVFSMIAVFGVTLLEFMYRAELMKHDIDSPGGGRRD